MKKAYYIAPVLLLAAFVGLYWHHMGQMEIKAEAKRVEQARIKAEADAKKQEAELRAKEDADKRIAEREAAERKKEVEKEAKRLADIEKIKSETDRYNSLLAESTKQAQSLEKQLKDARALKEKLSRDEFDVEKKVELAMIEKRNAELQVQRMAEIVALRTNKSTLTQLPTPAPVAK
jgi:DNA repair exonuclease SbcCD ATPase subunit